MLLDKIWTKLHAAETNEYLRENMKCQMIQAL